MPRPSGDLLAEIGEAIRAAGGVILGSVPASWGSRQVEVAPGDLGLFLADPRAWAAMVCGVSVADLDEYERFGQRPRCGGVTAKGKPCQRSLGNYSVNGSSDPADFVRRHRSERCVLHA